MSKTGYTCPKCGKGNILHPAVMPNYRRFCTKCGSYFLPSEAKKV